MYLHVTSCNMQVYVFLKSLTYFCGLCCVDDWSVISTNGTLWKEETANNSKLMAQKILHLFTCLKILTIWTTTICCILKASAFVSSHEHQSVELPRNIKQVKNAYHNFVRISHTTSMNSHMTNFHDFIHKIITYLDLIVICGLKLMQTEITARLLILHTAMIYPSNLEIFMFPLCYSEVSRLLWCQLCLCYKNRSLKILNEIRSQWAFLPCHWKANGTFGHRWGKGVSSNWQTSS